MNRFASLLVCGALLLTCATAHAKPEPLEVSKDNFLSLQFKSNGGWLHPHFKTYTVRNHKISRKIVDLIHARGTKKQPEERTLSPDEWTQLLGQLKKLNAPAIAGRYMDKGVLDAPSQSLDLTLFDASRHQQTFSLSSYGYKAPAAFYAFQGYLGTLVKRKFGPSSSPTAR
jgi:hypothetical protein